MEVADHKKREEFSVDARMDISKIVKIKIRKKAHTQHTGDWAGRVWRETPGPRTTGHTLVV